MENPPTSPARSIETAARETKPITRQLTATQSTARPRRSSWIASLTGICLLFGGLMALQLRAVERVRAGQVREQEGLSKARSQVTQMKAQLDAETARSENLKAQIKTVQGKLAGGEKITKATVTSLNSKLQELRALSGFAPVSGRGVRVVLTDNPDAAKNSNGNPFVPGIVHDYDLLQVVNELRGAKAEAIAVNGTRITAYTPIRCVGPSILINFDAATPPFVIEAIGNTDTLVGALKLPDGIVDRLKNDVGLGVKIAVVDDLNLAASENLPRLRVAKPTG